MDSHTIQIFWTRTSLEWHGDCDQEAILGWQAAPYLTLSFVVMQIMLHGSNDETDQPQTIVGIVSPKPTPLSAS